MSYLRNVACALLAVSPVILLQVALAKPDKSVPPPMKKEAKEVLPKLVGETQWGKMSQEGRTLCILGGNSWQVPVGEIRKDGAVVLQWESLPTLRRAIGIYKVEEAKLVGFWGWENEVEIDEEGELVGSTRTETVFIWP